MLSLLAHTRVAPGQTRILPIQISQSKAFDGDALSFDIHLTSGGSSETLSVRVLVTQLGHWSGTGAVAIKASYFSPDTAPIGFIVLPPTDLSVPLKAPSPPILALRSYILLMRCCHASRLSCEDRWCGIGYFQATFLGRIFTSPTTELGHLALGKDSVGMLSYAFVEFAIE